MNRDNTPWRPVESAVIEWTDQGTPYSSRFGDVYFSREDGEAESHHVFLAGNDLPSRWREHPGDCFCIGETGFGTGLNFLLTWQLWLEQAEPRPRLHYVSIEKFPLDRQDMARALSAWPALAPLASQLLQVWPARVPGQHRLVLEHGQITLDLWWEDVNDALSDLATRGRVMDAWYLDGFAPARNESMWRQEIYEAIAASSRPAASFSTFTAAGHVRRGLEAAGFGVSKVPGFGRKRECLRGALCELSGTPAPLSSTTPWDLAEKTRTTPRRAIVLGAGLAGCTVAAALARRGIVVTVVESDVLAGQASGNEQGVLYTRLSRKHSTLTDFALQSFQYSAALYSQMFNAGQLEPGLDGALCGSFHQSSNLEEMTILHRRLADVPELASVLSAEEAEQVLGIRPSKGGYWFPASGWLSPPAICRALIDRPGIELMERCANTELKQQRSGWQVLSGDKVLAEADCAVICAGTRSSELEALQWLPLQPIRGQTTLIPASDASSALRAALCHDGYISPASALRHCIGATFKLQDDSREIRPEEHRQNLDKLAAALPQWQDELSALDETQLPGRVGFRCASPDYLPIAGKVPDRELFLQTYGGLRKNARQLISRRAQYVPGLFVNTAHGSRGLSSAPLVAEILASEICNEPAPVSRALSRGLSPARFLIRDLSRGRI